MAISQRFLFVLPTLLELGSTLMTLRNNEDEVGVEGSTTTLMPQGKAKMAKLLGSQHDSHARCEDAAEGSNCYEAVMYLKNSGFKRHPSWYPGFTRDSLFQDVQAMLNNTGKAKCPKPCAMTTAERIEMKEAGMVTEAVTAKMTDKSCHDIVESGGEWDLCFRAIAWTTTTGIAAHPDLYPTLNANSSRKDVQEELYRQSKAQCPRPCRPERATPAPAPPAARAAPAGVPTAAAEQVRAPAEGAAQPDPDLKPLRDMTTDELQRYIMGEWDGKATTAADVSVKGDAPAEAREPEQAAPADTSTEEQAAASVSEEAQSVVPEPLLDTEPLPMVDMNSLQNETDAAQKETAAETEADVTASDNLSTEDPLPAIGEDLFSKMETEVMKDTTNATTEEMKETESKAFAEDEAAVMEPIADAKATVGSETPTATSATAQPVEEATNATMEEVKETESKTSVEDEATAMEPELIKDMADAKAMVGSETPTAMSATAQPEATATQDEAAAMEAEVMKDTADVDPEARNSGDIERDWGANEVMKDLADAQARLTTQPVEEATNATTEDMKETKSKTSAVDEPVAMEPDVTNDIADIESDAEMEAEITNVEMKEADVMNDTADVKPQVESETTAHDELAADVEAEHLKDTANSKPQVQSETTAQDESNAETEAHITKDTANAEPQVESKTAAHDELDEEMDAIIKRSVAKSKTQ